MLGLAAYVLWGVFPLYWPLLEPAGPLEILAHRFLESLVLLAIVITVMRSWPTVMGILRSRRTTLLLFIAAMLVSVNWGVFIWAVNSGHVVEGSLGYFINPLVSMALGLVFFRERLRPLQWFAVAVAAVAVLVLALDYGRLPWIALVLAMSFALYGLTKKVAGVAAIPSLTVETAFLTPVAIAYLVWLEVQGRAVFPHAGPGHATLMLLTGVVTAVPLLLFGAAAIRIPLTTLGVLQYVGPSLQFLIGVVVMNEPMPASRLTGFAIVWVALVVFTWDALRQAHRHRRNRLPVADPT